MAFSSELWALLPLIALPLEPPTNEVDGGKRGKGVEVNKGEGNGRRAVGANGVEGARPWGEPAAWESKEQGGGYGKRLSKGGRKRGHGLEG